MTAGLGVLALAAPAVLPRSPLLILNTTASAPLGLYLRRPLVNLAIRTWVLVRPPPALATWLDDRRELPLHVLLLKQVAAAEGAQVCRQGREVRVDGEFVARARVFDRQGRALPTWSGCRLLARGQVFLLNAHPDSLDSRYFGAFAVADVVGSARPIFTWTAR